MIKFGAWSTLLALLAGQMILLALALFWSRGNKLANASLGALLLVLAGMLTPFVLGYAGFYDAHPWLTAAPFAVPLAAGPLFYGYVRALTENRPLGIAHFAAPGLQFAYQTILFAQPLETRWWWDEHVHLPYLGPVTSIAVLISMGGYATAAWRSSLRYEAWLTERRRAVRPARRVRLAACLLGLLLCTRAGYELFEAAIRPVGYFDLFGFYVLLGVVGLSIGLNGWRHADSPAPAIEEDVQRDWAVSGRDWLDQLRASGWWRDPELDMPTLARRLGTNVSHLSRALNAEAGGFATVLARLRAEAVAEAIDAGAEDDLLTLALNAGFGSKASFNRAFRARFELTPREYRAKRQRITT